VIAGWTICSNYGSDRPAYEADLLVCRLCGFTIFMCHSVTKKPLPASVVAERCSWCNHGICGRCKKKMLDGGICSYFLDRIGAEEEEFAKMEKSGSWISASAS
jgi:hypothetical protein